jgi:iron(III) transport system substrate-binding protein
LDWVLTEKGQQAMADTFRGAILSGHENPKAKINNQTIKMISYNSAWAGDNRARLLKRFEQEIRNASAAR